MSGRRSLLALLTLVDAFTVAVPTAGAATVTNTNDSGPGSLRQATIDAGPGETIAVPAGVYNLTSGPIAIEKSLTLAGAGASGTVIHASASNAFLVFGPADVGISGIAFRDFSLAGEVIQGGVIRSAGANLTLNDLEFTGNTFDVTQPAKAAGVIQGGLILANEGNLTLVDSTVTGNTFDANGGGGQNGGVVQGGAILYTPTSAGTLTITGTSISNNLVDVRGGEENAGGVAQGGLVLVTGETSMQGAIRSSSIAANTASTGASGIVQGAGAMLLPGTGLEIALVSSTVAGNTGDGGGISLGGNLFLSKGVAFANTVVANGVGPSGSENCFFEAESKPTSRGFNLDSLDQCNFHGAGDLVNRDPQLGPLGQNGGPTPTMVPAPTSPLVDQGASFGLTTDQRGIPRPIDFPSIPNSPVPGADGSDIGAIELQPSNAFSLGKLTRNKKKGIARLIVNLPVPNVGTLTLSGKGLKTRTQAVTGTTSSVTFVVATVGKVKKAPRKRGKRKVGINVTYAPLANAAATQSRKAKLVKKKPRRKGGKKKHSKPRH